MRKDMDKLLVTTPRVGSGWKNGEVKEHRRKSREGDYDNLPSYSSMKPKSRHWDARKQLNEYLNPLVRYLAKNCGRPWDKVYSEICENMDRRGIVQDHIFQHLFDYVECNPIFRDGKPHSTGYGGLHPLYKSGWTFYVDRKGTLREPKHRRPPYEKRVPPNLVKTDDDSVFYLKREDGTWFMVSLEDWPSDDIFAPPLYYKAPKWIVDSLGKHNISNKKVVLKTLSKKKKSSVGLE